MSKKKRLPYHAGQRIDTAVMNCVDAVRELKPIIERATSAEERGMRVSRTIILLQDTLMALKEIEYEK